MAKLKRAQITVEVTQLKEVKIIIQLLNKYRNELPKELLVALDKLENPK